MGKAYSGDLRERIYGEIAGGESYRAAARRFGMSASTGVRIAQRMAPTGSPARRQAGESRPKRELAESIQLELRSRQHDGFRRGGPQGLSDDNRSAGERQTLAPDHMSRKSVTVSATVKFSENAEKSAFSENGRGERIRTSGPCLPKTVLYQAELLPDRNARPFTKGPAGPGVYRGGFRGVQAPRTRSLNNLAAATAGPPRR